MLRLAWWMLPVFVAWTLVAIFATEPILSLVFGFTPATPGETFYLEDWGPWVAVTLVWLAPLVIGVAAAIRAIRRGAGKWAWVALVIHSLLFVAFTVPNVIERILFL